MPRRHQLLLAAVLLALLASIWPGYLLGDRVEPYLMALPFSMVWLVAWVAVVFIALLLTFLADTRAAKRKHG